MKHYRNILLASILMSPTVFLGQAPPTIAQALAKESLGTTDEQLYRALRDPRPGVRSLAAGQLAENHNANSVAYLLDALDHENDPLVKANLARALTAFHDRAGMDALVALCKDSTAPGDLRIQSADNLSHLGDESCFPSIVKLDGDTASSPLAQAALLYFLDANKEKVPAYRQDDLLRGLESALQDPAPGIRQAAAQVMEKYDVVSAQSSLEDALAREHDPGAKAAMLAAKKALSKQ
jgi:HEAT repeat protein